MLRDDFPDISISKIRFLESEGLITPQRAPSGYRRYTDADVERLRYVLTVQREHYLPLKVIREHLELIDRGLTPPSLGVGPAAGGPGHRRGRGDGARGAAGPRPQGSRCGCPGRELLEASGLTETRAEPSWNGTRSCCPGGAPPTTVATP